MNKDKVLFESDGGFMKVKSHRNSPFFYAERKGVDSVAFILYDGSRDGDNWCLINEGKPPFFDRNNNERFSTYTAFGGSNDGELPLDVYLNLTENEQINYLKNIVKNEVLEEAGFDIGNDMNRIEFMSKDMVSTQMNQYCFLYLVDVSGLNQGKPTTTDPEEYLSYPVWMTNDQLLSGICWKAKVIYLCAT